MLVAQVTAMHTSSVARHDANAGCMRRHQNLAIRIKLHFSLFLNGLRIKSFLREWGEDGPVVHAQAMVKVCGLWCVPVSSCLCVPSPPSKVWVWHTPLENNSKEYNSIHS